MKITARREDLDLTPQALAERLQLTPPDVLAHERGGRRFSVSALLKFAAGLECSAIALLDEEASGRPRPKGLRIVD